MNTAGILHEYCMNTAGILQEYCRNAARILQEYCMNTAGILHEYCMHTAGILHEYCRKFLQYLCSNHAVILKRSCSMVPFECACLGSVPPMVVLHHRGNVYCPFSLEGPGYIAIFRLR